MAMILRLRLISSLVSYKKSKFSDVIWEVWHMNNMLKN